MVTTTTTAKPTLHQINESGTQALFAALGPVNATRFLRQFDHGKGDYTAERADWADAVTLEDITAASSGTEGK